MRQPIQISHERQQYQVIFRRRGGVQNWNIYVEAETLQDAEREARLVLAYDRQHYRDDLGDTQDRDWITAEIRVVQRAGERP